jgi:hypothetical protein
MTNELMWISFIGIEAALFTGAFLVLYSCAMAGRMPAKKISRRALWRMIVATAVIIGATHAAFQFMFYYMKELNKTAVAPWKPPPPRFHKPPPHQPVEPLLRRGEKLQVEP